MAITKSNIMKALKFWKTKLGESKKNTVESEEDQKKEAAAEQADEEQAEIDAAEDSGSGDEPEDDADFDSGSDDENFSPDADFDQAMDDDGSDEGDTEDDTGSDTDGEAGDDASEGDDDDEDDDDEDAGDDESEDDGEDAGEDEEDSAEEAAEGDDEDDGEDDEGESEFKLEITAPSAKLLDAIPGLCKKFGSKISVTVTGTDPEGDGEEGGYATTIECQDEETLDAVKEEEAVKEAVGGMDGELNESLQYEPNTVGAVIKLLSKSDPRDFLFIRLAPNMKQCMIYDIDRKVIVNGQSVTYMEIAIGDPNK